MFSRKTQFMTNYINKSSVLGKAKSKYANYGKYIKWLLHKIMSDTPLVHFNIFHK